MKTVTTYLIAAFCCAGYLNAFNSFLEAPWKMSTTNIIGRSVVWPWTLGEILCGVYMGDLMVDKLLKAKPEVETKEEYKVPGEIEPRVFEGGLRV